MSSQYTGNPSATEAPAAAPGSGVAPIVVLPADGDAANAASVAQAFKVLADYVADVYAKLWLAKSTTSSNSPQLILNNAGGKTRSVIDHNGYPGGKFLNIVEWWGLPTTSITSTGAFSGYSKWTVTVGNAAGSNSVGGQGANNGGYNAASMLITPGTNASDFAALAPTTSVLTLHSSLDLVLQFDFSMSAIGANNVTWKLGFDDQVNYSANSGAYFQKASTDTNWQCVVSNAGVATTVDSGVAPVVNTPQRFRIEYHGSATAYGSATVEFFINESSVLKTTNINIPGTGNSVRPVFYGTRSAANSTTGTLGIMWMVANHIPDTIGAL